MAETRKKIHQSKHKPNSNNFLGCFGFSRKVPNVKRPSETVESLNRRRNRLFSCFFILDVKKLASKTVPLVANVVKVTEIKTAESDENHQEIKLKKSKSKSELIKITPKAKAIHASNYRTDIEISDMLWKNSRLCVSKTKYPKKISNMETGWNRPDPTVGQKQKRPTRKETLLRYSKSLPAPNKSERMAKDHVIMAKRYDPIMGMCIIMVTLIIMLIWGRLCAVMCTAAWFYFVARCRRSPSGGPEVERNENPSSLGGLGSEESKRKVVFEGFLWRNRPSSL